MLLFFLVKIASRNSLCMCNFFFSNTICYIDYRRTDVKKCKTYYIVNIYIGFKIDVIRSK